MDSRISPPDRLAIRSRVRNGSRRHGHSRAAGGNMEAAACSAAARHRLGVALRVAHQSQRVLALSRELQGASSVERPEPVPDYRAATVRRPSAIRRGRPETRGARSRRARAAAAALDAAGVPSRPVVAATKATMNGRISAGVPRRAVENPYPSRLGQRDHEWRLRCDVCRTPTTRPGSAYGRDGQDHKWTTRSGQAERLHRTKCVASCYRTVLEARFGADRAVSPERFDLGSAPN